ncbi:MAG: metalloregulator ArsR/SmtB family transcription factor [Ignavibacteria bacterium]|nr:helix-turn-helix transcriptional regulator [Ignavibacteria bacterium]MBK7253112.1 helix-turn-helix transcriptional regulator [Ignavibacteria bacterium]MBK7446057.1 helix-turn-helix transcriptional regulator [Ignavibacteria bacterium]MBK8381363.1 helix-turn-helix transcriptional regulator [Ignavibacteria bacterium]MBK9404531.1 helix-turn-helix transcriptional regulator [Ignavibacteria bacterium]
MPKTSVHLTAEEISRVAEILKTIGHPVRLQILEALEDKEPLSVTEIQERIESATEQSLLSHHLIKMKDRGILRCEKQGMNVMYRLEDRNILKIFECMESCSLFNTKNHRS